MNQFSGLPSPAAAEALDHLGGDWRFESVVHDSRRSRVERVSNVATATSRAIKTYKLQTPAISADKEFRDLVRLSVVGRPPAARPHRMLHDGQAYMMQWLGDERLDLALNRGEAARASGLSALGRWMAHFHAALSGGRTVHKPLHPVGRVEASRTGIGRMTLSRHGSRDRIDRALDRLERMAPRLREVELPVAPSLLDPTPRNFVAAADGLVGMDIQIGEDQPVTVNLASAHVRAAMLSDHSCSGWVAIAADTRALFGGYGMTPPDRDLWTFVLLKAAARVYAVRVQGASDPAPLRRLETLIDKLLDPPLPLH